MANEYLDKGSKLVRIGRRNSCGVTLDGGIGRVVRRVGRRIDLRDFVNGNHVGAGRHYTVALNTQNLRCTRLLTAGT